ncbi:MAG: ATP/GTP-binding protein [Acidithiobacillus sp.]|nr:ATP/GTP-binding protein [Acidithiobacillus sp.]
MAVRKILIAGHVGAGKTTALRTLFGETTLTTDARYSERSVLDKASTTVAMDYGVIDCPLTGDRLHLYAIPGQPRFQFMWEILSKNVDALLLLMDAHIPKPLDAIHVYLDGILPYIRNPVGVIALNKMKQEQRDQLQLPNYLRHGDLRLRLTTTDVRQKEEVMELLRLILGELTQRPDLQLPLQVVGTGREPPEN